MSQNLAVTLVQKSSKSLQRLGCKDTERVAETLRICLAESPYLATAANTRSGAVSLCVAVARALALGLDPSGGPLGSGYLVPFKVSKKINGKWEKEDRIQFIPGYQGLIGLARQAGIVKAVHAEIVYEGDTWEVSLGTDRGIIHRPNWSLPRRVYDEGTVEKATDNPPILAYATWVTPDGAREFYVMSMADVMRSRGRSSAWNGSKGPSGPWVDDPEAMVCKTVIKKATKLWGVGVGHGDTRFAEAIRRVAAEDMGHGLAEDMEVIDIPGDDDSTDATRAQDALADSITV